MPPTLRRSVTAAWLLCALIVTAPPGLAAEPNLDPVLLRDAEETRAYIADFPVERYRRVKYPNTGCRLSVAPSSFLPCLFDWWMEPIVGTFWIERDPPRSSIKNVMTRGDIWEPLVARAIQTHAAPESTAVDVGAYIGTHAMLMGGWWAAQARSTPLSRSARCIGSRPERRSERHGGRCGSAPVCFGQPIGCH